MSERYSKIFSLSENLYAEGSPVVIKAGALLKDNKENKLIAQLKLQNISQKSITRVKVELTSLDSAGNPIANSIIHEYSDLTVTQGTDFGTQTPIIISNLTVTSYIPCIKEVTFTDGTLWNDNGSSLKSTQNQTVPTKNHAGPSKKKKNLKLSILVPVLAVLIAVFGYFVGYPMIARLSGNHTVYINMYNVKNYKIPVGTKEIKADAFKNCDFLESVTIPNTVSTIGDSAFFSCGSLKSIEIPNSVTSIGDSAFFGCDSLKSIEIPNSVTSIGESAFYACDNITSVVIGDGVETIGQWAFSDCVNISSLTLGKNVTYIGNGAFRELHKLNSIVIPDSVKTIDMFAFSRCHNLSSITLGKNVQTIGKGAFDEAYALTTIVIPNNVTTIGEEAFDRCENLTSVVIGSGITSIGANAFSKCNRLCDIYYAGTEEQWNSLDRPYFSKYINIHCNYNPAN